MAGTFLDTLVLNPSAALPEGLSDHSFLVLGASGLNATEMEAGFQIGSRLTAVRFRPVNAGDGNDTLTDPMIVSPISLPAGGVILFAGIGTFAPYRRRKPATARCHDSAAP